MPTGSAVIFDDFSSSKRRQKRITMTAVLIGIVCALCLGAKFVSLEKKGDTLPGALAKVEAQSGKLMIKRGAGTVAYKPGFIVLAGDTFQTIGESAVVITYLDDGTTIALGPDTTLLFNGSTGGKRTNMAAGVATFQIPPQPEEQPMVLASYNADATVTEAGTITQAYSGLATSFEVASGSLRVRRYSDGRITQLKAGQSHVCRPDDLGVIKFNPEGLK